MDDTKKKKLIKLFADKNNRVTVICPGCGYAKQLDVSKFRNINRRLKGRCKCGESFSCTVEFRQYFRKKVKLKGQFVFSGKHILNKIIIDDVSQQGIRFLMPTDCDVKVGDILEVSFALDDVNKTVIKKQVEVKSLRDQFVGCQFTNLLQEYDKHLGFYLRP